MERSNAPKAIILLRARVKDNAYMGGKTIAGLNYIFGFHLTAMSVGFIRSENSN